MRSKEQILNDTVKVERGPIPWDSTASIHERLTIEVLIDIRDELSATIGVFRSLREEISQLL